MFKELEDLWNYTYTNATNVINFLGNFDTYIVVILIIVLMIVFLPIVLALLIPILKIVFFRIYKIIKFFIVLMMKDAKKRVKRFTIQKFKQGFGMLSQRIKQDLGY